MKLKSRAFCGKVAILLVLAGFLSLTLPMAFKRPIGGDRIGQTAGIVRIYCEEPHRLFFKGPQIHYGRNPFNMELTVFEWAEGAVARAIDGPECDSVEPVVKVIAVLFSALGVLAVALLAAQLAGAPIAGLIAALMLATDSLWLRYAAYSMIEERVLALAALAILAWVKRRPIAAFTLWSLVVVEKPQSFLFASGFWLTLELCTWVTHGQGKNYRAWLKETLPSFSGYLAATALGGAYFAWSGALNTKSDLPWVMWTGPFIHKWFFGNWGDRLTWSYFRGQLFNWIHHTSLVPVAAAVLLLGHLKVSRKEALKRVFWISLPVLTGVLALTSIFYHVFIVHEYYALPLNMGLALTTGGALAFLLGSHSTASVKGRGHSFRFLGRFSVLFFSPKVSWALKVLVAAAVVAIPAAHGLSDYRGFTHIIDDPRSPEYLAAWNVPVFPKKHSFVVMAMPGDGPELFPLYLAKQRGFMWCAQNPEFAPRAFWKSQGVEYVAWSKGKDPATGRLRWEVRTLNQELELARKKGWSSDARDAWAGRTMAEWTALGSRLGKLPCRGWPDPGKW